MNDFAEVLKKFKYRSKNNFVRPSR